MRTWNFIDEIQKSIIYLVGVKFLSVLTFFAETRESSPSVALYVVTGCFLPL